VLATQIRQKDGIFYFGSVRAPELLAKVRFISRFYGDGEEIVPARISQDDDIAQFIAKIERTDRAFQRTLSRAKVRQLKNFYETAITQPPIPGTVLLFTPEKLRFQPLSGQDGVGQLAEPQSKFLIIDGQHRLAALRFYLEERPDDAKTINVPCVIFDGRSEDFATEMFVIITPPPRASTRAISWTCTSACRGRSRTASSPRGWSGACTARATARCATASTASADAASRTSGSCRRSCSTSFTGG